MELYEIKRQRLLWAKAALWLGWLSLVPLFGVVAAALSALTASLAYLLAKKRPARYGGLPHIYAGLVLCLIGMVLLFLEARLFLDWKITQAYQQRMALSVARMYEWSRALENYRLDNGTYPETVGLIHLRDQLVPRYAPALSIEDGWGDLFQLTVSVCDYTLKCVPPAAPSRTTPSPMVVKAYFPLPPPPPAPLIGPPAPWPPPFAQQTR
ncbi:MAG: hypothetical protein JHC34_04860 [Acidobacteria bacterium]|nr:hypothetical protein [Acidobacteriota bacterium]